MKFIKGLLGELKVIFKYINIFNNNRMYTKFVYIFREFKALTVL